MRAASLKRQALLRERRRIIDRMEPAVCPRCHERPATDVHETVRRSQYAAGAADERVMIQICRPCHHEVTFNPTEADYAAGWVVRGWQHRLDSETYAPTIRIMPAKSPITLRVSPEADAWINELAKEQGVSRSTVTRAMLSVATAKRAEVIAKVQAIKAVE